MSLDTALPIQVDTLTRPLEAIVDAIIVASNSQLGSIEKSS